MPTFLRRRPTLVCGLFAVLLVCRAAAAQTVTGNIAGTVTDSTGGVLVGATVTLVNEKTGEKRNLNTNEDGRFMTVGQVTEMVTTTSSRYRDEQFTSLMRRIPAADPSGCELLLGRGAPG